MRGNAAVSTDATPLTTPTGASRGRKILPLAASIAGPTGLAESTKTLVPLGFPSWHAACSCLAGHLKARAGRHLLEFSHAVCSWLRVDRTGCHPNADLAEIVVAAGHRL